MTPAPELRDIAPPVDVFPYPIWMVVLACVLVALLLGLVTWSIIRWWKNRPAPPPPTPREIALAALRKAGGQIARLDPYDFSILVSDILRAFVAAEFRLHAPEQTSPEFLASIAHSPRFSMSDKSLLALFLEKCDLIKFARVDAAQDDSAALLDQAMNFVKGPAAGPLPPKAASPALQGGAT